MKKLKKILKLPKTTLVSGSIVFFFIFVGGFAPWIANKPAHEDDILPIIKHSPDPSSSDVVGSVFSIPDILAEPSESNWLGTDYVGRDVASRLVHGIKNSLFFSLIVVFFCLVIGILIGGVMGFFGGWIDLLLSRFMEVIANFPIFLLQLTFLAFFPKNYFTLFFVMIVAGWIPYCRYTRAEFLRLRNLDFTQAARALGANRTRVFFRHILPNSLTPNLMYIPFDLASTITALGALSFLGFGEPIHVASLGELMKQAKDHFQQAWWLAFYPGVTLVLLTFSLAMFGASIRDILDPRTQT